MNSDCTFSTLVFLIHSAGESSSWHCPCCVHLKYLRDVHIDAEAFLMALTNLVE